METIDLTNQAVNPVNPSPVYAVRESPWDYLPPVVRGMTHIDAALTNAGLNWNVVQEPVIRASGKPIKNRVANIREDTDEFIEVVSNRYEVFQNRQAFAFLESILDSGALQLENAGYFGYDRVFLLAKTDGVKVLGDAIEPYALIANSHDGSTGVKVCLTTTRVRCRNTLSLALKTAERIWQARHLGTLADRMKEAQNVLSRLTAYMTELPVVAEDFAGINISEQESYKILGKVFQPPKSAGKIAENRAVENVRKLWTIHNETDDLKPFRNTAWGWYLAMADFTTHEEPLRKTQQWQESRIETIVADGHPLLAKMQNVLMEIPA